MLPPATQLDSNFSGHQRMWGQVLHCNITREGIGGHHLRDPPNLKPRGMFSNDILKRYASGLILLLGTAETLVQDNASPEVVATLLDEGQYLSSAGSWHEPSRCGHSVLRAKLFDSGGCCFCGRQVVEKPA